MIPAIVLTRVIGAELRGFQHILSAQFLEHTIAPSLLITGVVFVWYFNFHMDSLTAISIAVISALFAVILSWMTLKKVTHSMVKNKQRQQKSPDLWRVSIPFAVIAFAQIANAKSDILLLGVIRNDSESGIYTAATNVSDLLTFALIAMNIALAPLLVKLKETHSIDSVQILVTKVSRLGLLLSAPLFIITFLYSSNIVSIYGSEFESASTPLRVLVLGQIANISCGPVILLMMMLGLEKKAAYGSGISLILHVLLSLLLIPNYGVLGATVATGLTVCFLNIYMTISLTKNTRINPTPFYKNRIKCSRDD
jgi:O-antigen/teichoic acid export membrane protein